MQETTGILSVLILKYWNLVGLNRYQICEGPQGELKFLTVSKPQQEDWYWWGTQWGRSTCQNSLNEIKTFSESNPYEQLPVMLDKDDQTHSRSVVGNTKKSKDILKKNQNGTLHCISQQADEFYIRRKFVVAFTKLSDIFYKHRAFLDIAMPQIFRMIDF